MERAQGWEESRKLQRNWARARGGLKAGFWGCWRVVVWQIAERIYCALFLSAAVLWSLHGSTVGGNGVRGKPPMLGMAGDGLCNDRVVVRFQNGAWRSHRTSRPPTRRRLVLLLILLLPPCQRPPLRPHYSSRYRQLVHSLPFFFAFSSLFPRHGGPRDAVLPRREYPLDNQPLSPECERPGRAGRARSRVKKCHAHVQHHLSRSYCSFWWTLISSHTPAHAE